MLPYSSAEADASRRDQCCTVTLLHMNRRNKTESVIFLSLLSFLFREDLTPQLIISSLQLVLCHVAAVKRLPVYHHSADYFLVRWDH